jgi:hypothetical protein
MLPPTSISQSDTKTRSSAVKQWMASLSLPASIRNALNQVADAVVLDNPIATSAAIERLIGAVDVRIDDPSANELRSLASDLNPPPTEAEKVS